MLCKYGPSTLHWEGMPRWSPPRQKTCSIGWRAFGVSSPARATAASATRFRAAKPRATPNGADERPRLGRRFRPPATAGSLGRRRRCAVPRRKPLDADAGSTYSFRKRFSSLGSTATCDARFRPSVRAAGLGCPAPRAMAAPPYRPHVGHQLLEEQHRVARDRYERRAAAPGRVGHRPDADRERPRRRSTTATGVSSSSGAATRVVVRRTTPAGPLADVACNGSTCTPSRMRVRVRNRVNGRHADRVQTRTTAEGASLVYPQPLVVSQVINHARISSPHPSARGEGHTGREKAQGADGFRRTEDAETGRWAGRVRSGMPLPAGPPTHEHRAGRQCRSSRTQVHPLSRPPALQRVYQEPFSIPHRTASRSIRRSGPRGRATVHARTDP